MYIVYQSYKTFISYSSIAPIKLNQVVDTIANAIWSEVVDEYSWII